MRPRILTLLAIALTLTACSEITDPSLTSNADGLSEVRKTTPIPAMAMSCLERTRSQVMNLFYAGTLTEEEANMLLNRIDNVIRQIEKDHQRPTSNIADSYNVEVDKLVEWGRLTAEQASSIRMSFECIAPVSITTGETHTCVLLSDNSVWCWGNNANGQLGNGSASSTPVTVPVRVSGFEAAQIDAGGSNTCAVTPAGLPYCWGKNEFGQLGVGTQAASSVPVAVSWPVGDAVAQLSVGWAVACGRTAAGRIYCWGQNDLGGAGTPNVTTTCGSTSAFCAKTPVLIDTIGANTERVYTDVDVGFRGGCAVDAAGAAYCWGQRANGAIGDDMASNATTARCWIGNKLIAACASKPTLVVGGNTFRSIQFGSQNVCAIRTDDQVMCWGANDAGQLGIGSLQPFRSFHPMQVIDGLPRSSIAAADAFNGFMTHVCGLDSAGNAFCWGNNDNNQLGAPNNGCTFNGVASACSTTPEAVTGFTFKKITVGRSHSCGITADNRVMCWGGNDLGQLGDGTTTAHAVPTPVVSAWSDTP